MALVTAAGGAGAVPAPVLVADPYPLLLPLQHAAASSAAAAAAAAAAGAAASALDSTPTSAAAIPDLAAQLSPGSPVLPPAHGRNPLVRCDGERHANISTTNTGILRREQSQHCRPAAPSRQQPEPEEQPQTSAPRRKRLCTASLRWSDNCGSGTCEALQSSTSVRLPSASSSGSSNSRCCTNSRSTSPPLAAPTATAAAEADPATVPFVRWGTPNSWFCFPPEIRNQIYDGLLQLPTSFELYSGYYAQIYAYYRRRALAGENESRRRGKPRHHNDGVRHDIDMRDEDQGRYQEEEFPKFNGRLHTPSILLACRAITAECLPLLHERTLVVDRVPPWPRVAPAPLPVSRFVGRRTLQRMRTLEVRLELGRGGLGSGWVWNPIVADLLGVLVEASSLARLRLIVKLFRLRAVHLWTGEEGREWDRLWRTLHSFQFPSSGGGGSRARRRPPVIEVDFWEVSRDGVFQLRSDYYTRQALWYFPGTNTGGRPWEKRFERVSRIGDWTDPELVPGSVTDLLIDEGVQRAFDRYGNIDDDEDEGEGDNGDEEQSEEDDTDEDGA